VTDESIYLLASANAGPKYCQLATHLFFLAHHRNTESAFFCVYFGLTEPLGALEIHLG